ncbi:MAG: DUF2807 domain-containing protein [Pseudomonadota bacterium]|nr:DUF2807 domain-containing protein [Pseudomonadota bacterium]
MRVSGLIATFFAAAAFTPAGAQTLQEFKGADSIAIVDFTGTVEIVPGGDKIAAALTEGARATPVDMQVKNGVLVVAGERRSRNFNIHDEIDWRRNKEHAFEIYLRDYPTLKIHAPLGSGVTFERAVVMAKAGDTKGDLRIDEGYVEAVIGDVRNADIRIVSSGDVALGAVSEALMVRINGSGDVSALSAGRADLRISGSGDVTVGPVAGGAGVDIGGSGDVSIASAGGVSDVMIGGSGDVRIGEARGGAKLSIAGSGDITVADVSGPAKASIAGNGDIRIDGGRAENLVVTIAGSGDFTFGGVSTNLDVSVVGSGDVVVAENEGSLRHSGRGDIVVGGRRLTKD